MVEHGAVALGNRLQLADQVGELLHVPARDVAEDALSIGAVGAGGFAIGVGALAATAEASVLVRSPIGSNQNAPAALGLAFVGAYSVYEVALFAFTPLLGGVGAFTPHIILRLGALNLLWLIGLSAVCVVCRHLGVS